MSEVAPEGPEGDFLSAGFLPVRPVHPAGHLSSAGLMRQARDSNAAVVGCYLGGVPACLVLILVGRPLELNGAG